MLKHDVFQVVKDRHSKKDCKKNFAELLGEIESKGPNYVDENFTEIRDAIAELIGQLVKLTAGGKIYQKFYREKLERLQETVATFDKKNAYRAIAWARKMLRANVPELLEQELETDKGISLKEKFGALFKDENIKLLMKFILECNQGGLIRMGKKLKANAKKMQYFSELMKLFPSNEIFVEKYAESVYYGKLEDAFVRELEAPEKSSVKRYCIELYGEIVRDEINRKSISQQVRLACNLLEPYLDCDENKALYMELLQRLSARLPGSNP